MLIVKPEAAHCPARARRSSDSLHTIVFCSFKQKPLWSFVTVPLTSSVYSFFKGAPAVTWDQEIINNQGHHRLILVLTLKGLKCSFACFLYCQLTHTSAYSITAWLQLVLYSRLHQHTNILPISIQTPFLLYLHSKTQVVPQQLVAKDY